MSASPSAPPPEVRGRGQTWPLRRRPSTQGPRLHWGGYAALTQRPTGQRLGPARASDRATAPEPAARCARLSVCTSWGAALCQPHPRALPAATRPRQAVTSVCSRPRHCPPRARTRRSTLPRGGCRDGGLHLCGPAVTHHRAALGTRVLRACGDKEQCGVGGGPGTAGEGGSRARGRPAHTPPAKGSSLSRTQTADSAPAGSGDPWGPTSSSASQSSVALGPAEPAPLS